MRINRLGVSINIVLFILIAILENACGEILQHPIANVTSSTAFSHFEPRRIVIAQGLSAEMQDLLGNSIPNSLTERFRACDVSSALGMSAYEVIDGGKKNVQTEYDRTSIRQLTPDSTLLFLEKSRTKRVPYNSLMNVRFHATLTNNSTGNVVWSGDVWFEPAGKFTQRPIAGGPTIAQALVTKMAEDGLFHNCLAHEEGMPVETVRTPRNSILLY